MSLLDFLKLDRPLIGLDVETHDKVPPEQARVCEIGFKILYPDGREPKRWSSYVKPPVPIQQGATEKHHITNEMVDDALTWGQIAPKIAKGFSNCDFIGYNIRFDIRVVFAEMQRVHVPWTYQGARLIDGLRLWHLGAPRTLTDAVREFCGRGPTEAHRAMGDAEDAIDVVESQLRRFTTLPRDVQALHDLCFTDPGRLDPDGKIIWSGPDAVFSFGKYSGRPLRGLPVEYLEWVMSNNFSPEVKQIVGEVIVGRPPVRKP